MFLKLLPKEDRLLFLKIAKKLVITNEKFADFRRLIIDEYYHELGLGEDLRDHDKMASEERALEIYESITPLLHKLSKIASKQIVFFEIAGLMQIDLVLSSEEAKILELARIDLDIGEEKASKMIELAGQMVKDYFNCLCFINDLGK